MSLYSEISTNITGRLAISQAEADYLERRLSTLKGLHVEIGTLWGGTAILAAMAKPAGSVVTLDYMQLGFWETGDPECGNLVPSLDHIYENLKRFGISQVVTVVKSPSFPFPLEVTPESFLIDGDHEYEGCVKDWNTARAITKKLIFVHDYGDTHPGVRRMVREVAFLDKDWRLHDVIDTLAVFEKIKK